MAGIGFELRKYLEKDSYLGTLTAYAYAGIIGAGPWVLSIVGVILVGIMSVTLRMSAYSVVAFLVSVTYLMAGSLILTGFLQLVFIRFVADTLFRKEDSLILPNVIGALFLTTVVSGLSATLCLWLFFPDQSLLYRLLMTANFVMLCNVWLVVIFASGTKKYHYILKAFFAGYLIVVIAGVLLQAEGIEGLLTGLLLGHSVLFFFMLVLVFQEYSSPGLIRFDFLQRGNIYLRLVWIGFFFNAGIWIDKFLFWLTPATSEQVIGPLRFSVVYDLPIFLAYLSIIPGMAVFLLKIETDFVEVYDAYFKAVREGATLQTIEEISREMMHSVQDAFLQIIKMQGLTIITLFLLAPSILTWLNISHSCLNLLYIDIVAVALQVIVLSILNILFYLDRLTQALVLTFLLLISNASLTFITLQLGPSYYGLGFFGSMLITSVVGFILLNRSLEDLNYRTFMLQV